MSPLGKILFYIAAAGAVCSLIMGGLVVKKRMDDKATIDKSTAEMLTAQQQAKKATSDAAELISAPPRQDI